MPIVERIESWSGQDVLDSGGEKVGRLDEVYYDPATSEPVLLSVKHGLLGRQVALIPAAEAVVSRDYVRVPYSAEQIERAQRGGVEDELSGEEIAAVAALFGVALPSSGPLYSASLIKRRHAEAGEARQHALALGLEAGRRKEEAEEAREHADAAAEQAHGAEREHEQAETDALEARRRETSHPPPSPQ
ncbi:MAG: PRC-barrel domain-containing protein [Solirubrobacteraceae bacterium]